MIQSTSEKIVRFDKYCQTCRNKDKDPEQKDICHECLSEPTNLMSEKPINYEN